MEASGSVQDGVAREFAVRALALEKEPFVAPPADAPWSVRYDALEALRRRAPGRLTSEEHAFARTALADAHPNIRATALLVHAAHELALVADFEPFAAETLPALRVAFARALTETPGEAAEAALLALTADPHAEVAREARLQLLVRSRPGVAPLDAQRQLLLDAPPLAPGDFLDLLDLLERTPLNAALVAAWHEHLRQRALASGLEDDRARLGLVATLPGRGAEADVIEGWGLALAGESSLDRRARRARLERYVDRRSGSAPLSEALLARALAAWEAAEPGDVDARWEATELLRLSVQSFGSALLSTEEGQRPREYPYDVAWATQFALAFWEAAGTQSGAFDREARRALRHSDADVREAAVVAVGRAYMDDGSAAARGFLVDVLGDEVFGPVAYIALVRRCAPLPGRVHEAWRAWGLETRLRLLEAHAPDCRRDAWLNSLIHLWGKGTGQTPSVIERLGDFTGDGLVERTLRGWIHEELAILKKLRVPPESETRGRWRDAESRALALVRAWLRVRGDAPPDREVDLLLGVGRLGKDLGKLLVAEILNRDGGRVALREVALRSELSRRLRVEIVLLEDGIAARAGGPPASPLTLEQELGLLEELFVAYDAFDEELQLRVLRRAAGLDLELARARLLEVALDGAAADVLRRAAAESLATAGPPEVVTPLLEQVSRQVAAVSDHDLRRAVIRALGACAPGIANSELAALYVDEEQRALFLDVLLPAMVATELRAPDKATGFEVWRFWIEEPRAAARVELEARFVGARLPARDFDYAGWLEAARALAAAGELEAWLRGAWWTFDGRLLARLAEVVREADGPDAARLARTLDRAAFVALQGEADAPDRDALLVRQRAHLLRAAILADDPPLAARWARRQLDEWNGGRVSDLAWRSTYDGQGAATGELVSRLLLDRAANRHDERGR